MVQVKYFKETLDFFAKPLQCSHLFIFLESGLRVYTCEVKVNHIQYEWFSLPLLGINVIIPVTYMQKLFTICS